MAHSQSPNRKKKWSTLFSQGNRETDALIARMASETGLSEITARLLYIRGYRTAEEAMQFLRLETTLLHDPFLMKDMDRAVERVSRAIRDHEKIAIYGDYDVDGVTSVSLLYLYLKEKGADVGYYIPSRSEEGYGLSVMAVDRLKERGVELIITVDTGITANVETEYAASLGIDTVVTDHHECRAELPNACAVINPHRPDDSYPFSELAGVGVVFKLVCACEMAACRERGESELGGLRKICRDYADLAAIGTVADVMPVSDENRFIISYGLHRIRENCRVGLRALIDAASGKDRGRSKPKKITSTFIGFVIAPRMNAAGRVSRASIAAELLLSEDYRRASELAQTLCRLNTERQTEENRICEGAYRKIEEMAEDDRRCVIVLDDDTWHQGIIGIVSSRITERYGLPSILISYGVAEGEHPTSDDVGKGSGRSIKGLNLVEALTSCEDLLVRYGGHELAAGLSICRRDVDRFRRRINEYAEQCLDEDMLCVRLEADCEVGMKDLTMQLAQEIEGLEPFGISNPVPTFILRDATLVRIAPMGGGKHLRLTVEKDGQTMNAVWFGRGIGDVSLEASQKIDLFFQLSVNEFQNVESLQLILSDAREAESETAGYADAVARYEEIRAGADLSPDEDVIPSRDDVAAVYTFLRREFRAGKTSFPMKRLLLLVRDGQGRPFGYVKMKFIIRILQELQICGVAEPAPDHFLFDIFYSAKTNLEKSSILHRLRAQQRRS